MDGPESGRYRILPAPEGPGVGADDVGSYERPVVFDSDEQVWKVEQFEPGRYWLTLERGGYSFEDDKKRIMVNVRGGPGQTWRIHRWGNSAFFIIEKDSDVFPEQVWTLFRQEPKEQVVLRDAKEPYEFQMWYFEHVDDD